MAGYTQKANPKHTSKAIGFELDISEKKSVEVCRAVRGMKVNKALDYLESVVVMKKAIPYKRFTAGSGHKKGMASGGYPGKAAAEVIKIIESAQHNAEYKGLDPDEMKIKVIAAHRGRTNLAYRPRAHGRSTPFNNETVNIEVILESLTPLED